MYHFKLQTDKASFARGNRRAQQKRRRVSSTRHFGQLMIFIAISCAYGLAGTGCDKSKTDPSVAEANSAASSESAEVAARSVPKGDSETAKTNDTTKNEGEMMGVNPKLKVGDVAPSWKLDSDNAGVVDSNELKGHKYILYFYPKDQTKGCTLEAIDFQENEKAFADKGYKIFGVSTDGIESHKDFRDTHDLQFTLLSDPDHKVMEEYGVWRTKNLYGKEVEGTVRSTFVIDEEGKIAQIHDNVRATGHVERLLKGL